VTRQFRRAQKKKFLKEQKKVADWCRERQAAVEYAIVWKRKPGVYEEGRHGPH